MGHERVPARWASVVHDRSMDHHIRLLRQDDRPEVLALAQRLAEGVSPWRDPGAVATAVRGWVEASASPPAGSDRVSYVAESGGELAGFVAVEVATHWSGDREAYIG